ncbi:MAG TPA: DUF2167 domain-containing protein [Xanthomonadaceae bacterium]|jgi:uncharacterized membrane-anchored protein|nr:DUF2167 domain-containing protein [Xanthomonadaceae bacterium]
MRKSILAISVAALLLSANLCAQDASPQPSQAADSDAQASGAQPPDAGNPPQPENPRLANARAFLASLHYRQGDIAVPGANAHFNLGPDFRFLDQTDARKVLEQLWRNPPNDTVLGLIVPATTSLIDDHAWAVVVTRTDEGHVSDADAQKTDYTQMLKDMQQGIADANPERQKAGYSAMTLVGWAEPPHYDEASKKLYWARELSFSDAPRPTLNYDVRVLGRTGFLSLNAVAGMDDAATVRAGMQRLLPMVEFDPGQRYADFNPSTDRLAEYGIAALVAGGIAAKAGLFAKLGVILLAAKKFIILAVAAVGAWLRKLFGGKDKNKPGPTVQ